MNGEGRCKLFRLSCPRHLDTLICSELSIPEGACGYCPPADTPAHPETTLFLSETFYLAIKDKEVIKRTLSPTMCPQGLTLLNFASHFINIFFYSVTLRPTWPGDCDLKSPKLITASGCAFSIYFLIGLILSLDFLEEGLTVSIL